VTRWSRLLGSDLLRKGGTYVFASGASQGVVLLSWLALPWALSIGELGQFALVSFGIDLLAQFILMGMDAVVIRFLAEEEHRSEVMGAVHAWLAIGLATAVGFIWLTRNLIPSVIPGLSPIYSDLMWLMLATAAATALATVVFSHHVALGAAQKYAKLTILRSVLLGGGSVLAAFLGFGVAGLVWARIIASFVVVASFYGIGRRGAGVGLAKGRVFLEVAKYGLPMMAYSGFSVLSDYAGRLLIGGVVSLSALGVFQVYYQIATQINGLWASLNRAWTPYVFRLLNSSRSLAFSQMIRGMASASTICALGLILCMMVGAIGLWGLLLPPAMSGSIELLYLLLLGPLFTSIYMASYPAFYYQKNTVRVSLVQSVVSVATMLMTVFLTITLQANGAAVAWVFGAFIGPIAYMAAFPQIRREMKPMLVILAIWGGGSALMVFSLLQLQSTLLASIILFGCAATVAHREWRRALSIGKGRHEPITGSA
jgi:O-antigen/teichoic acid export membrane protein